MRYLPKATAPPPALAAFLAVQLPLGLNFDYEHGFTRKRELREELIAEQYGLCGYTGVALDDRLTKRQQTAAEQPPPTPKFQAHIEHLKPQSVCRAELVARGQVPGSHPGEDMDHRNMIAALLVSGAKGEQFGAACRGATQLPVWPTHPDCEARFTHTFDGRVSGRDADAQTTVNVLRLNHPTLKSWRQAAIEGFFPPELNFTRAELEALVVRFSQPEQGRLREFCFVLKSAAESLLLSP